MTQPRTRFARLKPKPVKPKPEALAVRGLLPVEPIPVSVKCSKCGSSTMTKTIGDHVYRESGLEIRLRSIAKLDCANCGSMRVQIPQIGPLHRAIAAALAFKPARFEPAEVRFLRDHLELSNSQFADLMGVSPSQSSRWTTTDAIGQQAERFLRMLAVLGPNHVRPAAEELVRTIEKLVEQLPSVSADVKSLKIGMKKSGNGWKLDIASKHHAVRNTRSRAWKPKERHFAAILALRSKGSS